MRCMFLTVATLLCLLLHAQNKSDSAAIVQLLKSDYHTMMTHDLKQHMADCTDDYLLIEDGEIWNMEREANWYKEDASKVYDRKDYFDFKLVKILGNTADTVYHLQSDHTENGVLSTKRWFESVVFR